MILRQCHQALGAQATRRSDVARLGVGNRGAASVPAWSVDPSATPGFHGSPVAAHTARRLDRTYRNVKRQGARKRRQPKSSHSPGVVHRSPLEPHGTNVLSTEEVLISRFVSA